MYLIAECGCNWSSLEEAKEMIKRSKDIKSFASKFQLFTKEVAPGLPEYLYLDFDQAKELFDYGKLIGQEVFFTCMYPEAVDICEQIGVHYYKIRHKDRWNDKIIKKIWSTGKPYFISLSLSETHYLIPNAQPYCLYCIPEYPASQLDYTKNLTLSHFLSRQFVGISDHSEGVILLRNCKQFFDIWFENCKQFFDIWFEKHMKLEGTTPLENDWSVSFKEVEEIL